MRRLYSRIRNRSFIILAVALMVSALAGPLVTVHAEEDVSSIASKAKDVLISGWQKKTAEDSYLSDHLYLDIKNTRVVELTEEPYVTVGDAQTVPEVLSGVRYLVEFLFYSNYMGDSYPVSIGMNDTVAVYSDGHMELVSSNPLQRIRSQYYVTDFSGIIKKITDLGTALNTRIE